MSDFKVVSNMEDKIQVYNFKGFIMSSNIIIL